MIPVIPGDDTHTYALAALQLRDAALETLMIHGCEAPPSLTSAILTLHKIYHDHPDTGVYDPDLAAQLGVLAAYWVWNGEVIALKAEDGQRGPAYIQKLSDDKTLQSAWQYRSVHDALEALGRWQLHVQSAPTGWSSDEKGSAAASTFGVDIAPPQDGPA